jgi:hypothetical protein
VTPPEKPEHQQGSADENAERTSVITKPAGAGQEPGQDREGSGSQDASHEGSQDTSQGDGQDAADQGGDQAADTQRLSQDAARQQAAAEAEESESGTATHDAPTDSVAAPESQQAPDGQQGGHQAGHPQPAAEEEQQDAATVEEVNPAASVPPPWQRVTTDAQYLADHPEQQGQQPTAAGQPGYAGYPAEAAGQEGFDPEATVVNQPTLNQPGSAASHLFGGGQGGYAGGGGLGSSRTAVNLGSPTGRAGTAAPSGRRPGRGPRRASLQVKRVDPWSVLKLAGVLSVAMFFVWMVAVGVLYGVLDGMGVWDKLNGTYNDLVQGGSEGGGGNLISVGRVFGVAAVIGVINIVLFTALATVSAFIYNVSADLAGGLEVTLSERE